MIYRKKHIKCNILHFKRWSNKSYAAFYSIGRIIHICFLGKIIQGLKTVKSILLSRILELFPQLDVKLLKEKNDTDLPYFSGKSLEADLLFDTVYSSAYTIDSIGIVSNYQILIISVSKALRGPFLFSRIHRCLIKFNQIFHRILQIIYHP